MEDKKQDYFNRLLESNEWPVFQKMLALRMKLLLNMSDINEKSCNSEIGEQVKARLIAVRYLKQIIDDVEKNGVKYKEKGTNSFR